MTVYVAGPVLRSTKSHPAWVQQCYKLIEEVVSLSARLKMRIPFAEPLLEGMGAEQFATELRHRITNADSVIAVSFPDDQSVPVECALASAAGKRVLLLHEATTRIPRILAGMSKVTTAVYGPTTRNRIELFLIS